MAEGAGEEADDGVDEDHGGEFAAGEDVVADGEFEGLCGLDEAFIDALIARGDEEEAGVGGELFDEGLGEAPALGGEQDACGGGGVEGFGVVEGIPEGRA